LLRVEEVIEFGAGLHSTPLFLDRCSYPDLVTLRSYETDAAWFQQVRDCLGGDARLALSLVSGTMADAVRTTPIDRAGLILVDDSTTEPERCRTIESLARRKPSAVVIIHDFEVAGYRRAAKAFRNTYRVTALNPNVGILWNEPGRLAPKALRALERRIRALGPELPLLDRNALRTHFGGSANRG
jgi:hypothetical protein